MEEDAADVICAWRDPAELEVGVTRPSESSSRFSKGSTTRRGISLSPPAEPPVRVIAHATAATTTSTAAAMIPIRRCRGGAALAIEPVAGVTPTGFRASANSLAVANRSAGVLAIARLITSAISRGTASRITVTLGTSAVRCWCTMLSTVGPVNGAWPASISYSTQPRP